jgi:transcriptional regulator with XRE-family HTH domain
MKKSTMAQRIRAARQRAGLTQSDIAAAFGIDRTAISLWESRRPENRTRPDMSRLQEFARLTRTPVWWLLSDESDPTTAWPEITDEGPAAAEHNGQSWAAHLQSFWGAVSLSCRERRSDLWGPDIWQPRAPDWMAPLAPDVLTQRAAVQLLTVARPNFHQVAQTMASLLAFERLQGRLFERKTILVWHPHDTAERHGQKAYTDRLDEVRKRAETLGVELGVRYIEIEDQKEAVEYLLQIL